MRVQWAVGVAAIGLCLAGCGGSGSSSSGSAAATGTIVGTFRVVGGAPPGVNNPASGTITIRETSETGRVVASTTASAGHFTVTVPAGRYVAVGTNSNFSGNLCNSGAAKNVSPGGSVHMAVTCNVP